MIAPRSVPCSWRLLPLELEVRTNEQVRIEEVGGLPVGTVRYAVRRHSMCLNKSGAWEHEPMPSSRDDEFFERCRWGTFAGAERAACAAAEKLISDRMGWLT